MTVPPAAPSQGQRLSGPASPPAEFDGETERILACVHCGFCLDVCPTYTRLQDEADSPRGRLYLIRAVAEGRLETGSAAFRTHIDRCLGCRACEPICPSGVHYGHLLERARAAIARTSGIRWLDRALLATFGKPLLNRLAGLAGIGLRAGGLADRLARGLPARFRRVRQALFMLAATRPVSIVALVPAAAAEPGPGPAQGPDPDSPRAGRVPPGPGRPPTGHFAVQQAVTAGDGDEKPRVATLLGCVQRTLFERVNLATDRVLRENGCELVSADGQGCCGALHAHAGDLRGARRLARANIAAFRKAGAQVVVVNAAGCAAFMKTYGELLENDPDVADAAALAASTRDLNEYLVALGPKPGAPLPIRVAYDAPCHLVHAQGIGTAPVAVLAAIPGLTVTRIDGADECCGGAGTWGMAHPELGGRIQNDKVRSVVAAGADVVVTPNPGCIMQIGAGLRAAGDRTPVLHPVELLDESYRRQGKGSA